jgi:hypothetical protein
MDRLMPTTQTSTYKVESTTSDTLTLSPNSNPGGVYDSDGTFVGYGNLKEDKAYYCTKDLITKYTDKGIVDWEKMLTDSASTYLGSHKDLIRLASCAYGEGSTKDNFEEMAGIASVILRQVEARNTTISSLLKDGGTYAFASSGKCVRFNEMIKLDPPGREKNQGMKTALKAAINAITKGTDYSNGAYFWDGLDIKTNYKAHPKILKGFLFADKSHNIYSLESSSVDVTTYWTDAKGKQTKVRGKYTHTYESTAACGGTIFSKYTDDYLKAEGAKKYQ